MHERAASHAHQCHYHVFKNCLSVHDCEPSWLPTWRTNFLKQQLWIIIKLLMSVRVSLFISFPFVFMTVGKLSWTQNTWRQKHQMKWGDTFCCSQIIPVIFHVIGSSLSFNCFWRRHWKITNIDRCNHGWSIWKKNPHIENQWSLTTCTDMLTKG